MKKSMLVGGIVVISCLISVFTLAMGNNLIDHAPIVIEGNYQFTAANGVVSGSGTVDDPYIIAGWKIDAGYSDYGIRIHRTDRYFIIRNVEISGAGKAAVFLSYVHNGTIERCHFTGNWIGVVLNFATHDRIAYSLIENNVDGIHSYFSHDNQIFQNTITKNDTGVWLDGCTGTDIVGNKVSDNHMGVYLDLGSQGNLIYNNAFINNVHDAHSTAANTWDYRSSGNYWSDYHGVDADKNGIGDSPYVISSKGDQDNFPLLALPPQVQTGSKTSK